MERVSIQWTSFGEDIQPQGFPTTAIGADRPCFVAKDICDAIGITAYRDAIAGLDADERGSVLVDTLGGRQSVSTVSEFGAYSLILRSRKPEAKAFQRWLTHEVIPCILRKGACITQKVV